LTFDLARAKLAPIDAALLLMILIWGSNFTIVKVAVRDIPELPLNAVRLVIASTAFLITLSLREGLRGLSRPEWRRIALLAVVGHFIYQLLFLGAVARTSVAHSSLIFALTPITVALATSAMGHEPVPVTRWLGAVISLGGIYLVVAERGDSHAASGFGDLLAFGAVVCWAVYTVGAQPLLATRSPLLVTGYTMAIGSVLYLLVAAPRFAAVDWSGVRPGAWLAVLASALLALFVAYLIWYTAVQKLGNPRTALYSNLTPVAAMAVAAVWLGEPLTARKLIGTATVMAGLALARFERAEQSRTFKTPAREG
jgi:drug/metabolite transporter (DMT)-like permease